jgi:hypothetical protein
MKPWKKSGEGYSYLPTRGEDPILSWFDRYGDFTTFKVILLHTGNSSSTDIEGV